MSNYVYEFDPAVHNNTAATIYRVAARGGPRLLDVGSGPGIVAAALVASAGKDATCLDADADALTMAKDAGVGHTAVVDLRDPEWFQAVPEREYDVVILADVLEHLEEPERVLRTLREQRLVSDTATVVVSFPNAAHESIVGQLLAGTFHYTDTGLLDRTHLRFFTLASMRALLEENGFYVEEVHRTTRTFEDTVHARFAAGLSENARTALREAGPETLVFQYVLEARPASEPAVIASLRTELDVTRGELAQARAEAVTLRRRVEAATSTLEEERAHYAREHERLRGLEAQVARLAPRERELAGQVKELTARRREAEHALAQTKRSTTYRAGLAVKRVAAPAAAVRTKARRAARAARAARRGGS